MTDAYRSGYDIEDPFIMKENNLQRALDFLRDNVEVAFATSEGCKPHIRIFQTMMISGTSLFFTTSAEKAVYRQLLSVPYVEIMANCGQEFVRCSGRVVFDVDEATSRRIYADNPVLPRLYSSWEKLVYFRLDPDVIDHYDLRPTPPYYRHFDLRGHTESEGYTGERYSKKN